MTPTFLLVEMRLHCDRYVFAKSPVPNEKWKTDLKPFFGSPLRPKNQASHGSTVEIAGTPAASAASETGLFVSGVEVVRMRSTLFLLISSRAIWPARTGSEVVSLSMIWTAYLFPPMTRPLANAFRAWASRYGVGSPKPASGPVRGLMKPSLIVLAAAAGSRTGN